jgi:hypothetical protein
MTETTTQDPQPQGSAGTELDAVDAQLAAHLVAQARTQGISLVGPDGLLQRMTRLVVEGALEGELHRPSSRARAGRSPLPPGRMIQPAAHADAISADPGGVSCAKLGEIAEALQLLDGPFIPRPGKLPGGKPAGTTHLPLRQTPTMATRAPRGGVHRSLQSCVIPPQSIRKPMPRNHNPTASNSRDRRLPHRPPGRRAAPGLRELSLQAQAAIGRRPRRGSNVAVPRSAAQRPGCEPTSSSRSERAASL